MDLSRKGKAIVANEFYLFDVPGVEKAVEEMSVVVEDIVYRARNQNEAIKYYREEFPAIYERYSEFGAQDSEPQSEVCDRIAEGMKWKLGLGEWQACELYDALRWNEQV